MDSVEGYTKRSGGHQEREQAGMHVVGDREIIVSRNGQKWGRWYQSRVTGGDYDTDGMMEQGR